MNNNYTKIQKGFSLTEIILVVSILMILGSISITAYSSHTKTARDASRIKQSQEIADAFDVYGITKKLPQPEDSVEILANGTLVGYQGYASEEIMEKLSFYNGGLDPLDKSYKNRRKQNPYTYYMTQDFKHAQLLVFLEDEENIISFFPQSYAADYTSRTPKVSGKNLGVLTDTTLNTPIQEIDTIKSTGELDIGVTTSSFTAHISDERKITGNASVLVASTPFASCNRLSEVGKGTGGDKIYRVNPDGNEYLDVYCDMDIANGGWTLIGSKASAGDQVQGEFGDLRVTIGSDANVTIPDDQILNGFSEAMACSVDNCWKWDISDVFKECLRSGCGQIDDDNTLVRVKGSTGFSLGTTDTVWYNNASNPAHMFGLHNASTSYAISAVGAWDARVNPDGDNVGAWESRDEWNLYVR